MSNNDIISGFDDEKSDELKISLNIFEDIENLIIMSLSGYIDTYNSDFLLNRVGRVINFRYNKLIFEISNISYISSTGIGAFTHFLKTVRETDGDIVLVGMQPKVLEIFKLLGFSQFLTIKESLDGAVEHLKTEKRALKKVFPLVIRCPICSKKLKATKSGKFRCPSCKSILEISSDGKMFLG